MENNKKIINFIKTAVKEVVREVIKEELENYFNNVPDNASDDITPNSTEKYIHEMFRPAIQPTYEQQRHTGNPVLDVFYTTAVETPSQELRRFSNMGSGTMNSNVPPAYIAQDSSQSVLQVPPGTPPEAIGDVDITKLPFLQKAKAINNVMK